MFTVISHGYFDGAGSTITFSTRRNKDGDVELVQTAKGLDTDLASTIGILGLHFSEGKWSEQSQNLKNLETLK